MDPETTSNLLRVSRDGDERRVDELTHAVYGELKRLAAYVLKGERAGHTLTPTALVHEAYLRLVDQSRTDWRDRAHFVAIASRAMRRALTDYARRRAAQKRGGERLKLTLNDEVAAETSNTKLDLLSLEEALTELEALDERKARIVELRYFGGLSREEAAEVLDVSLKTVEADWTFTRTWLGLKLSS